VTNNVQSKCVAQLYEASRAGDDLDVLAGDVSVDIWTALFQPSHRGQAVGQSGTCEP
jgi:hypothetical protein